MSFPVQSNITLIPDMWSFLGMNRHDTHTWMMWHEIFHICNQNIWSAVSIFHDFVVLHGGAFGDRYSVNTSYKVFHYSIQFLFLINGSITRWPAHVSFEYYPYIYMCFWHPSTLYNPYTNTTMHIIRVHIKAIISIKIMFCTNSCKTQVYLMIYSILWLFCKIALA